MTNQTNTMNVLENVTAVQVKFSIWTGRKKLSENDLSLKGETPPREIVHLGSKHTTDPAALKVFHKLKRRCDRLLSGVGIPFLGGYAIPASESDKISKDLQLIMEEVAREKAIYLSNHTQIQQDWISKFPDYEAILVKALTPVSDVEKRINASFSMFKVQSANMNEHDGLSEQTNDLSESLDDDILSSARSLLDNLTKAVKPNQTNVSSLRKLKEKVDGLAFLNKKFRNLVNEINKVETELPTVGCLATQDINKLSGLLYRMSDATKLDHLMKGLDNDSNTVADSFNALNNEPANKASSDFEIDKSIDFDFDDSINVDFDDVTTSENSNETSDSNQNTGFTFF